MAIVTGETPGSLCVMKVAWRLTRIVKDHAKGVALASAQATDSMAHVHPIHAARTPDRAVMHGEDHRVPLLQGNHGGTRLHTRTLFCEDEFAAREITARL